MLSVGGERGYLHFLFAVLHRHTVSQSPVMMKKLISEEKDLGMEEEPELLVKGESHLHK